MTAKVKYSSAFTPVSNKTNKTFSHPFSIKNILNLDETSSTEGSEQNVQKVPDDIPSRSSVIRLSQAAQIPAQPEIPLPLRYEPAPIPAWIYATRYCRQGIPPGRIAYNKSNYHLPLTDLLTLTRC